MSDEVWQHPLLRGLRRRAAHPAARRGGRAAALAAEADALPPLLSHGDACPNNLLAGEHDDELVMIDFGFWGGAPVGFDLSQLLVGDIQIGKRGADDLAELDEAIVTAYVAGLRAEGCEIPEAAGPARPRALPADHDRPVDAAVRPVRGADRRPRHTRIAADRAELARYALDLLESTAGTPS